MEASLHPYIQGAIVEYVAPFDKKVCQRNRILSSHPVMIVSDNLATPSTSVQCMMLTSKVDHYYGYRLYVNSLNTNYRKFSVVCTTKIFTIEKAHLRAIIGFVSPAFTRKCLMAYLYEIGLTDQIPEYYQKANLAMEYINAGECNVPTEPECFRIPNMPNGSFSRVNIASDSGMRFAHPNGMKGVVPRVIVNPNEYDSYYYESMTMDENEDDTDAVERSQKEHHPEPPMDDPSKTVYEVDANLNPLDRSSETNGANDDTSDAVEITVEKGEIVNPKEPRASADAVLNETYKSAIEERDGRDLELQFKASDKLSSLMENLTEDDRYRIWLYRVSQANLVKEGKANSSYLAKKLMTLSNHLIKKDKEYIINGVLNKTLNLKFLASRYFLAFRCMTLRDIYDIKMGVATYFNYIQLYNYKPDESYIGELQAANLL